MADMKSTPSFHSQSMSPSQHLRLNKWIDQFAKAWDEGTEPKIEDFVSQAPSEDRPHLLRELIVEEIERLPAAEDPQTVPDLSAYLARFPAPEDQHAVHAAFLELQKMQQEAAEEAEAPVSPDAVSPDAVSPDAVSPDADTKSGHGNESDTTPPAGHPKASSDGPVTGRYCIKKTLGEGGFATVYLADDPELQVERAIKVPKLKELKELDKSLGDRQIDLFVKEARTVARLEFEGIVRVYDVLRSADGIAIVMQYVDGPTLAEVLESETMTPRQVAELLIPVARAIGHAHRHNFIHRDLKPANILLDRQGTPYVADFGLALHASVQAQHAGEFAGSVPYMSPEQLRGEAHRLDGRSDIWSLGVIMYELLGGKRPFQADSFNDLIYRIEHREHPALEQLDAEIPRELIRICGRCLQKRASQRYQDTTELIDDLESWLAGRHLAADSTAPVVPKGLMSFDAADADFFLQLLPGPRDRDALPGSIRFWKTQIEQTHADRTFSVGLIYGPSGCGKSSLVQAGLLPRLEPHVLPVLVEATATDTCHRLLNELGKHCPELCANASLPEVITGLRNAGGLHGRKVLIVLDQFEQWLHSRSSRDDDLQLVNALRQCDGAAVQCVLMVRDDFSAAVHRLFEQIEVRLVEGHNYGLVSRFDQDHARKVLRLFGASYGKLPESDKPLDTEQRRFLDEAVEGLSENGEVISVQLALFAQMMQARPWTPAGLRAVGGTEGVGLSFLEETFNSPSAQPNHRAVAKPARSVLRALLPEEGTDIKGRMRSRGELCQAAGYGDRQDAFEQQLVRVLDGDLRLITPTDPDQGAATSRESQAAAADQSADQSAAGAADGSADSGHYQLTHDFLVPALRQWLNREQTKTARGRAQLRLEELAAAWRVKQEQRHLPSLREDWRIRWYTPTARWNDTQRKMMRRSGRLHGRRVGLVTATALLLLAAGLWYRGYAAAQSRQRQADSLVQQILTAEIENVPPLVDKLTDSLWPLVEPQLDAPLDLPDDRPEKLRASLARLDRDPGQIEYLIERLTSLSPAEAQVVGAALAEQQQSRAATAGRLWKLLTGRKADDNGVLPVATALIQLDPDERPKWNQRGPLVSEALVRANIVHFGQWLDLLKDAKRSLQPTLAAIYGERSDERAEAQRDRATSALELYAQDQPELLAELLMVGQPSQYKTLFPLAARAAAAPKVREVMHGEMDKELHPEWHDPPADPAWATPTDHVMQAIEAAGGLVDVERRFAFCQSMPREAFMEVAERLRPAGFRATRLRPHVIGGQLHVAVVWRRDGVPWKIEWDLDRESLSGASAGDGFVPRDVAGYVDNSGEEPVERFVVLYRNQDASGKPSRLMAGLDSEGLESAQQALKEAGLTTTDTLHVFVGVDGRRKYSAVFSDSSPEATTMLAYAGWERVDQPQWDVALAEQETPTDL